MGSWGIVTTLRSSFESNFTSRKMLILVSFLQLFMPGKALILQTVTEVMLLTNGY